MYQFIFICSVLTSFNSNYLWDISFSLASLLIFFFHLSIWFIMIFMFEYLYVFYNRNFLQSCEFFSSKCIVTIIKGDQFFDEIMWNEWRYWIGIITELSSRVQIKWKNWEIKTGNNWLLQNQSLKGRVES